jgi:phage gpG-like protein
MIKKNVEGVRRGEAVPSGRIKPSKRAQEEGGQTLIDNGHMVDSIRVKGEDYRSGKESITIGPAAGIESTKGRAHQFGTKRLGKRPWMGVRKRDKKSIQSEINKWLKRRRKAAGLGVAFALGISLLAAIPAEASVWLIVFARVRADNSALYPDRCVDAGANGEPLEYPALTTEGGCTAAGHTWLDTNAAGSLDRGDIGGVFAVKPEANKMCDNYTPASGGAWACVEITDKDETHARNYFKKRLDANLVAIEEARFYVDVAALPPAVKDTLWNTGLLSRTWAQVKPFIMDKETGEVIP